nr:MAG TPA_asm: hypothetical protein [Caudoviricetes sp.]
MSPEGWNVLSVITTILARDYAAESTGRSMEKQSSRALTPQRSDSRAGKA